jgi:hypothetical protein
MGHTVGCVLDILMEVPTSIFTLVHEFRPLIGGGELLGSTRDEATELLFLGLDSNWIPFTGLQVGFLVGPDTWCYTGAGFRSRWLHIGPNTGVIRDGCHNYGAN